MTHTTRREFLRRTGLGVLGASSIMAGLRPLPAEVQMARKTSGAPARPNVLLIITDQQAATMLSCTGNKWLKTPAMDSLMTKGMRFEKAYATNPVCLPSRFSLMTGLYPTAVGSRHNGQASGAERFAPIALGHAFRAAGYETVYGGKVHLPGVMNKITECGFDVLTRNDRDDLAEKSAAFLAGKHDKPFLLVVSLINPHDICFEAILAASPKGRFSKARAEIKTLRAAEKMPDGVTAEHFYDKLCPPLPANYEPTQPEPKGVAAGLADRQHKPWIRKHWGEKEWRLHRWAYCRLTERVDGQVGTVLKGLRDAGLEDNTLVVFTSDHGDMDASHQMEHKSFTYEQCARIPLIVQYPPLTRPGLIDAKHLVCNGLDLYPTFCDIAGVKPLSKLPGRSLKPLLGGKAPDAWRETLMIETQFSFGVTDGRYKYTLFDSAGPEEMLCDLQTDPGEKRNIAGDPTQAAVLNRMRKALAAKAAKYNVKLPYPVPKA